MMKKYNTPEMSVVLSAKEDIMDLSDTFIDVSVSDLWGNEKTGDSTEG